MSFTCSGASSTQMCEEAHPASSLEMQLATENRDTKPDCEVLVAPRDSSCNHRKNPNEPRLAQQTARPVQSR